MNSESSRRRPSLRRRWSRVRSGIVAAAALALPGAVAGICIAAISPVTTAAQEQAAVGDAEARYRQAVAALEAVTQEIARAFNRYEVAGENVRASRGTDRADDAQSRFQTAALELMALEAAGNEAADVLEEVREAYLSVLEAREDAILVELQQPNLGNARSAPLREELAAVGAEMAEVELTVGLEASIELRPVPELVIAPTDGPVELRQKGDFMRSEAIWYDSLIVDLEAEITAAERRAQRERNLQDLQQGIDRFDAGATLGPRTGPLALPPADADADAPGTGEGGSQAVVEFDRLSAAEQVPLLRDMLDRALQARNEALAMAELLEERAEDFGP